MVTSPTSAAAGTRPAKVPKPVRPRRDFAAMEARRMAAVDMFEEGGLSKAEIGRRLGVSHQTVSDWHGLWAEGGRDALRGAGRAGRKPRLTAEQLGAVAAAIERGAKANGYPTDLWTLVRVAEVIERITGIGDHPGFSRQRPARRAVERDDEAVESWIKTEWPKIKKGEAPGGFDRVRGRVWVLPAPLGAGHLGAQGQDAGAGASFQLEAAVDGRRPGLRARRVRRPSGVRDLPRRLQRRSPYRGLRV